MKNKKRILFIVICLLTANGIEAQEKTDSMLNARMDGLIIEHKKLQKKLKEIKESISVLKKYNTKTGLSVGFRSILRYNESLYWDSLNQPAFRALAIASIRATDSTLQLDQRTRLSVLLSAVIMSYPFYDKAEEYECISKHRIGFIANINLITFADPSNQLVFNKKVAGGLGLCYLLSDHFSLAVTFEKVSSRRIRDNYFEKQGEKLIVGNQALTNLDINDNNMFRDDDLNAWSFKFVYGF